MRSAPLLLLILAASPAAAQRASRPAAERAAVVATVNRLFDAMRAADTATVRAVFHPTATLATAGEREGTPVLQPTSVDRFIAALGTPHDQPWDERIGKVEVRVDGRLATAWMPYAFYLGDRLSHCGTNAMELFRDASGWRITRVADTRQRTGCKPRGRR